MIGRVLDTENTVVFEIQSTSEIESTFHKCLDDYLETCRSINKDPHKSYNGSFNLRLPDDLYKALLRHASFAGMSINRIVNLAVKAYLEDPNHHL